MKREKGYSLIEFMAVLLIFGILLSMVFASMSVSRTNWQNASEQINRQQLARKAVDKIAWGLKSSSPSWEIDSVFYNISINGDGDQIDFYLPVFDEDNEITQLNAVRYYVSAENDRLYRAQADGLLVVTTDIDNIEAQKPFFSYGNVDRTIVDIKIPIVRDGTAFILNSQANLRNRQTQLTGVTVEEIEE